MIGIGIGGILLLLILVVIVFINTSPQFGGKADAIDKKRYSNSQNYEKRKFHNIGHVKMNMSLGDMAKAIGGMFKSIPNTAPKENLEVERVNKDEIVTYKGETRFIWFGHSSFLLQMDTKNILIDPMFGDVPAPNKYLGPSRFSKEMPIEIDELPKIDAVLLSHDHYDHLDYGSILRLKEKVSMFYVPLGLGNHLEEWGVSAHKIVELDWWEDRKFGVFTFRCTPAQHFSGRGLTDRAKTCGAHGSLREKMRLYILVEIAGMELISRKLVINLALSTLQC